MLLLSSLVMVCLTEFRLSIETTGIKLGVSEKIKTEYTTFSNGGFSHGSARLGYATYSNGFGGP